ncbi:MAG: biosynthetic peptidoglycan transglycosylase, partial [Actinomycetota bacterium]
MKRLQVIRRIRHRPSDVLKATLVLGLLGPLLVGGSAAVAFFVVPLPAVVPSPTVGSQAQTSFVYAADGSLIATFHSEYNRELIPLSKMPEHLQQAAVASEDARFYKHGGLDVKAITRALAADIRARETVQGGSTITQQFVKNAYIDNPKSTVFRKVREALISAQVERTFTKKKILELYLNTVYFGKGAYGVEAAAKTYFNKPASKMTISESALLVGVIPAPVRYSPFDDPKGADIRRLRVLRRMQEVGFIDVVAAEAARAEQPVLAAPRQEVFRYPWFVDALQRAIGQSPK